MYTYGSRKLEKGIKGEDVAELQLRLAGFSGTVFDGDFGPGTEEQVKQFQKDYMKKKTPNGIVDRRTFLAIDKFADKFPIDFGPIMCPCGACDGFGRGLYKDKYNNTTKAELYYMYEYPGIHRSLLWSVRALYFYEPMLNFITASGYRCSERNKQKGRTSTNHCGKAIDIDVPLSGDEDRKDDMARADRLRDVLVSKSSAQIGWKRINRKSLEPSNIAPTWVHYDVRQFKPEYLKDEFFCKDLDSLNNRIEIMLNKPKEKPEEKGFDIIPDDAVPTPIESKNIEMRDMVMEFVNKMRSLFNRFRS